MDGIFQITPIPITQLKPHQLFHHRSYVAAIIDGNIRGSCSASGKRYHSLPYLDLVGNGIVVTLCYPITQALLVQDGQRATRTNKASSPRSSPAQPPAPPPVAPQAPARALAGAFCIDLAPPRDTIRTALAKNPFFKVWLVRITHTGPANARSLPDIQVCDDEKFKCTENLHSLKGMSKKFRPTNEKEHELVVRLAQELFKNLSEPPVDGEVFSLQEPPVEWPWWRPSFLKSPKPVYYGVRLWTSNSDTPRTDEVAVLKLERSDHGQSLYWMGCVAFSLVVAYFIASARKEHGQIRESALMRNLQLGIVRLKFDAEGQERIVGANDRAEELLGVELPRLGIADTLLGMPTFKPIYFQRFLVSPFIAEITEPTQQAPGKERIKVDGVWVELSWMPFSKLMRERQQGIHSVYFAKLYAGKEARWFKISGTPIRKPDGGYETFGLFDQVLDQDVKNQLDTGLSLKEKKEAE